MTLRYSIVTPHRESITAPYRASDGKLTMHADLPVEAWQGAGVMAARNPGNDILLTLDGRAVAVFNVTLCPKGDADPQGEWTPEKVRALADRLRSSTFVEQLNTDG